MDTERLERAVVATFPGPIKAEDAIKALEREGVPVRQLSILGSKWETREALLGHWVLPDWQKVGLEHEGEREGFLVGGAVGTLGGFALVAVPGLGPLVILGALAGLVVGGAIGSAVGWVFGEATSEEVSTRYRERLAAGNFLVVAMATADEVSDFHQKVEALNPLEIEVLQVDLNKDDMPLKMMSDPRRSMR